jgi:ribosomal-protein-alanine N-acetyltransferase
MTQSMDEVAVVIEPMRLEDLDEVAALDAAVSNPVWSREMFESELTSNQFAGFLVARVLHVGALHDEAVQGKPVRQTLNPQELRFEIGNTPAPSATGTRVVCGYIGFWIVFEELHVLNVAVHPDWRRRGVATRLVHTVFEMAIAKGVIRALLEVRASNLPAQQLYARFGFQAIARRSGYYTQPSEEALIMARDGVGGDAIYQ